jgi:integrase
VLPRFKMYPGPEVERRGVGQSSRKDRPSCDVNLVVLDDVARDGAGSPDNARSRLAIRASVKNGGALSDGETHHAMRAVVLTPRLHLRNNAPAVSQIGSRDAQLLRLALGATLVGLPPGFLGGGGDVNTTGKRPAVQELLRMLEEQIAEAAPQSSPTLVELWPIYVATEAKHLKSVQRSEWAWQELRHRVCQDGTLLGDRQALTVTAEVVEHIRTTLRSTVSGRGRVYSAATVNRHCVVLRRLLRWAHETNRIPHNPLASLRMEPEHNIRRTKLRGEAELQQLLAKCNKLTKALVLVLFDGGLRKSEALNLRRDQVVKKPGGGAIIELSGDETKNGRPRQPHITQRTVDALENIPSGGPYYFAKPSGVRYSPRYQYTLFQRAVAQSGLQAENGESITLHSLRHSFAYVRRVRDHWPESLVMDQGGWLTDSVCRRYGITDHAEREAAMAAVEQRIARDHDALPSTMPTSQNCDTEK